MVSLLGLHRYFVPDLRTETDRVAAIAMLASRQRSRRRSWPRRTAGLRACSLPLDVAAGGRPYARPAAPRKRSGRFASCPVAEETMVVPADRTASSPPGSR